MSPLLASFLILLGVIAIIAVPMYIVQTNSGLERPSSMMLDMLTRQVELLNERQVIYQKMIALDFDYSVDKISEEDYAHQHYALMQQAISILKELDTLADQLPAVDQVERAVDAYRSGNGRVVAIGDDIAFCPGCGERVKSRDRFCGTCGEKLARVAEVAHAH